MIDQPEKNQRNPKSSDDKTNPITELGFRPDIESKWEKNKNSLLEKHPYIVGYLLLSVLIVIIFAMNLKVFALSFLFLYLISDFLTNDIRRFAPFIPKAILFSILYLIVITLITILSYKVIPDLIRQLPGLAEQLQARAITQFETANKNYNLTDYINPEEVRSAIVDAITKSFKFAAVKFSSFYKGFIYFIFALVINLVLYHNTKKIDIVFNRKPASLMNFLYCFTMARLRSFYYYFKKVMGGQFIISAINTLISSIVIIGLRMPHPILLIFTVFFCGLLPIIGNIISNTIVTITAIISIGFWAGGICLVLLVGIHKLEYFLNSKIIGDIVHLPMVITLTSLVVCDVLFGILGLILAIPLVLWIRHELENIPGVVLEHQGTVTGS